MWEISTNLIEEITKTKVNKRDKWINLITNELKGVKERNIFEWTENFDGRQEINGKIIYYNLKMICSSSGAQTRPWREVCPFISAQQWYLNQEPSSNLFFVNIIDGECYKKLKSFPKIEQTNIHWFTGWVQRC